MIYHSPEHKEYESTIQLPHLEKETLENKKQESRQFHGVLPAGVSMISTSSKGPSSGKLLSAAEKRQLREKQGFNINDVPISSSNPMFSDPLLFTEASSTESKLEKQFSDSVFGKKISDIINEYESNKEKALHMLIETYELVSKTLQYPEIDSYSTQESGIRWRLPIAEIYKAKYGLNRGIHDHLVDGKIGKNEEGEEGEEDEKEKSYKYSIYLRSLEQYIERNNQNSTHLATRAEYIQYVEERIKEWEYIQQKDLFHRLMVLYIPTSQPLSRKLKSELEMKGKRVSFYNPMNPVITLSTISYLFQR